MADRECLGMKLCVIITKYVNFTREEPWTARLRALTRRRTLQALSVKTPPPKVPHGVSEDDNELGEGYWEQRRIKVSELPSAAFYSSAGWFGMQERAL